MLLAYLSTYLTVLVGLCSTVIITFPVPVFDSNSMEQSMLFFRNQEHNGSSVRDNSMIFTVFILIFFGLITVAALIAIILFAIWCRRGCTAKSYLVFVIGQHKYYNAIDKYPLNSIQRFRNNLETESMLKCNESVSNFTLQCD